MAKPRRRGTETSETRFRLLDVTEQIMLEDGYAAVSSRRVAKAAGVTPALVHYYFATLDDLFLAVLRRRAEQQLERQRQVLESSPKPLHALWERIRDPARTSVVLEFMALANHRKAIRDELATHAAAFREGQLEALKGRSEAGDLEVDEDSLLSILVLVNAIATDLVLEQSIGLEFGHEGAIAVVEGYLDRLDKVAQQPASTGRS